MRRTILWTHPSGKWKFRLREWECCGQKWELLLSKKFPERENWNPICKICGKEIDE